MKDYKKPELERIVVELDGVIMNTSPGPVIPGPPQPGASSVY